ncbi:hypothetical protein JKF63_06532 [Porcisia hertigi]|uniref:Uracil-DNA glycosylase n=1 Tax=Porcisia hertigi TaxID=2761500 RepID=A0A836IY29_9TRYP|nr:hypothetical protein JKF63_06532 [Porcisia hertigi]
MQKTLFDFLPRGISDGRAAATVTPIIAVAESRVRPRQPFSDSSGEDSTDGQNSSPGKIAKTEQASRLCREHKIRTPEGARRDDAIDLDASAPLPLAKSQEQKCSYGGVVAGARRASRSATEATKAAATATLGASCATASPLSPSAISSHWLASLITNPEWRDFLVPVTSDSWRSGAFLHIERFLDTEKKNGKVILPPTADIFNAFNSCPFRDLKVVLLGQDPYHDLHQAHGLCFSVLPGVPLPPSLRNMYKELSSDIAGFQAPKHGYLQSWSEQGMLMLNATLTVEAHKANSHSQASGWSVFTDAVIEHLSRHHPNRLVFLLWGSYARKKKQLIDTRRHIVLESVHPSPLSASRGWFGCRCFSACNEALLSVGHPPMQWQLPLNAPLHGQ